MQKGKKKKTQKRKKNLKMSLTFAYFNFGILLLELASGGGGSSRWATASLDLIRMIGLHAAHTVAPVAEEIAHKQQRYDAEDHKTATPGSVHECH